MRRATQTDFASLSDIYFRATDQLLRRYYGREQIDYYLRFSKTFDKFGTFIFEPDTWIYEIEGSPVGFGGIEASGYIASLYVDPDYCRTGIGTVLLKHMLDIACERSLEKVFTIANPLSKAFFQKNEFRCVKEETRVREGVPFIRYHMELRG